MNVCLQRIPARCSSRRHQEGMSLLAMIAIVAIISIFMLALLRALIREIDHAVARKELATLKIYKQGLEGAILRNGQIPAPEGWAAAVAAEVGADATRVGTNPRHGLRILMVDTNGWLGGVTLPYTQNVDGSAVKPENARMMIVSSLGEPVPDTLGNYPAGTEFAALWNCREGTIPATTAWTGWDGRPDDVKVERVLLDPLFLSLRLATSKSEPYFGQYAIGGDTTLYQAPLQLAANPPRYLLRGTKVWLYTSQTDGSFLDSRQILTKSAFYRYEDGIWKSNAAGADLPGGMDLAAVVKNFLEATPNTNALHSAEQQAMVVEAFMDYMQGYIAWGQAGFPDNAMRTEMLGLQDAMMTRCQEIFMDTIAGSSDSYFPINNGPCE